MRSSTTVSELKVIIFVLHYIVALVLVYTEIIIHLSVGGQWWYLPRRIGRSVNFSTTSHLHFGEQLYIKRRNKGGALICKYPNYRRGAYLREALINFFAKGAALVQVAAVNRSFTLTCVTGFEREEEGDQEKQIARCTTRSPACSATRKKVERKFCAPPSAQRPTPQSQYPAF